MRLDLYLHLSGKCPSRQRGRYLIDNGQVTVDGKVCTKPSFDVEGKRVEIMGEDIPYVSRGGLKLEGALDGFGIKVEGLVAADIGSSTGGFTHCLLLRGAKKVFAVDSGTNQLHPTLRGDDRVVVMENFNARALDRQSLGQGVDIVVMDVSFISQGLIYPAVCSLLDTGGKFLSLIKPQFEAGRDAVNKKGIVSDKSHHARVIEELMRTAEDYGLAMQSVIPSPIQGGDGNIEYLAFFIKDGVTAVSPLQIKKTVYGR